MDPMQRLDQRLQVMRMELESCQKQSERAKQEKERLVAEVAAAKSLVAQHKQLADRLLQQTGSWKQVIQSLELSFSLTQRQESDLQLELSRSENRLMEQKQKYQELDQYLTDDVPVLMLEELNVRDQDLDNEIKEKEFEKDQREKELARLRAEQIQVSGDNWSTKQTVGDESTGRVSDADDELELQYCFTRMHYGTSDFLSLD